ncbi:uncharacterized protein MYCFIDRAFT_211422 [Pseudocercospora fijiensis CIRAD86]|uniref:Zn(2)-C6 fungal-type domain-containing protein n=1 Tax=Pseudocercospora fijiensis (strain CIRAD86) TaxID=383855 RepID=M2YV92_PSEFD|nr:uncharacterized protein MYCFIDRAFT_211422 [Pseudocercospora fijiensis CIRAD86]EME81640.1 hypothetical protein MYCFIDRAFT_211422 [Pseudocercospora fijiensis CIRAD86]
MSPSEKPSRHVCPDCGRSYKAAETLNRHRKNHSDTTAYTCDICHASFKRKDLLDRHSNIHSNGRQPTSRNRSQRACDRCSRLKTRCDNLVPCTRCTRGGHACTYRLKSCRARTDRSSTASIDTMPSSRSSVDLPGAPAMFQQPRIQVQEDWPGLWQESNIWSWPEVETDPSLQRPPTLVPTSACAVQPTLSPWTGEIDPMLMEASLLSPFQSVDSDPGSPCSGSSIDQWTSADLHPALTSTAFDDMDLSPAITPFQPSLYLPPQFDYKSLPEPACETQNIPQQQQQQTLITELATVASNFSSPFTARSHLWSTAAKTSRTNFHHP